MSSRLISVPLFISVLIPVILGTLLYQLDSFDPASYPNHVLSTEPPMVVAKRNNHMLHGSEKIGVDRLLSPEDVAYDSKSGVIYTGCVDGWVRKVKLNDSRVEDWVFTGGRPLGLALGLHGEVIVADANKLIFVAEDGIIYFSDASYKYKFQEFIYDILEGRPYGRLLSYDPSTKQTKTLLGDLRKCKTYHLKGQRKGSVEIFVENLPGFPDNILYDGEGHYWIAFSSEKTYAWDLALRNPFIRKIMAIIAKYVGQPHAEKNGGVLSVDLQGNPVEHYYDGDLTMVSSATKIGDHLYCGSVKSPYMLRLNLKQNPAVQTS